MAAYATAADLLALRPDLADAGEERIGQVLSLVSAAIAAMCDADSIDPDVLELVACQASARMLQADASSGITQESWGASPYSGSVSYANPTGDVYLTAFERKLLGIDGAEMSAAWAMPGGSYEGGSDA